VAREKRTKTFTYKHADFTKGGVKLQQGLSAALGILNTVGKRRNSLAPPEESPIWRLIGEYYEDEAFFFGTLMQYSPGTNPQFLIDDHDAKTISVEQLAAPKTTDGKNRELIDGMLFFAASDNHLVLMQGLAMRSQHLEQHLQWLLHKAGALAGDVTIRLLDQPPRKMREKLEKLDVREIVLDGDLSMPIDAVAVSDGHDDQLEPAPRGSKAKQLTVSGDAGDSFMQALRPFLAPAEFAKLDLEKIAGANIAYSLQIRYQGKNTTENGHKFLNTLGAALRHTDSEVQTEIKLVGGGLIRGNELKLSGPRRIEHISGVPVATHVFEEMRAWLLERLKSGDIEAS
jgi:hypothetical protein